MGKQLWQLESIEPEVTEFTDMIIEVACHILNVDKGDEARGTFTANDVDEGKIKGTLRHKNKLKVKDSETPITPPDYIMSISNGDKKIWSGSSKIPSESLNDEDLVRMSDMDDDIKNEKEALGRSLLGTRR